VARLGGDEFAIVLVPGSAADEVAQRVLATLSRPIDVGAASVRVSASIGIGETAPDPTHDGAPTSTLAARLQHRADVAMYAAKAAGKHRWRRSCDDRGVLGASPQDEPPDLELDLQGAVPARPSARPPRVPRARAVPARPPFPS